MPLIPAALVLLLATHLNAQRVAISGNQINLPAGDIMGAAFVNGRGTLLVEQNVVSPDPNGPGLLSRRQLSAVGVQDRSTIKTLRIDEMPTQMGQVYACGNIQISLKTNRIFLCSPKTHLEMFDLDTWSPAGTMAPASDRNINDFALDDARDRAFVLSNAGKSLFLTSYSISTGARQNDVLVPAEVPNISFSQLALIPETGNVGVAAMVDSRSGEKGLMFVCDPARGLACRKLAQIDAVSQLVAQGRNLLAATTGLANRKSDCITGVDSETAAVSRAYCAPASGVHYAVGLVDGEFVAGFTGVAKYHAFTEDTTSVSNSYSLWRVGAAPIVASVADNRDYGSFQDVLRIVGDSEGRQFGVYRLVSNALNLYSIEDK